MINLNIDLGQIIIGILITTVGYLIKREVNEFGSRVDRHDTILFELTGTVQRLMGHYERNK
jgi:hypothetical protein